MKVQVLNITLLVKLKLKLRWLLIPFVTRSRDIDLKCLRVAICDNWRFDHGIKGTPALILLINQLSFVTVLALLL